MSKLLENLGGTTGAVVAGGGMIVAIALGAYLGFGRDQDSSKGVKVLAPAPVPQAFETATAPQTTAPQTTAPQSDRAEPQTSQPPANDSAASQPAEDAQIPVPQFPSFDELRRESDGTTVIAGRAAPLSEVSILVDGTQVATTRADSSGGFAAIAQLAPNGQAQVVTLSARNTPDASDVALSREEIILAPLKAPVPETDQTQVAEGAAATTGPAQAATAETAALDAGQVAVLKSGAQGVQRINTPAPSAMTAVALDTIGYSRLGDVQLAGRAQPDTAQVRVYLDNRSVVSLPVGSDGRWQGDLPQVDEGVYTLRLDEVSAQGAVSSRVETPFKRESAQVLEQASAQSGGAAVTSVTVQAGATLWAIARDRYGDGTLYVRVFEANAENIRNPDLIYPGQVFDLPK